MDYSGGGDASGRGNEEWRARAKSEWRERTHGGGASGRGGGSMAKQSGGGGQQPRTHASWPAELHERFATWEDGTKAGNAKYFVKGAAALEKTRQTPVKKSKLKKVVAAVAEEPDIVTPSTASRSGGAHDGQTARVTATARAASFSAAFSGLHPNDDVSLQYGPAAVPRPATAGAVRPVRPQPGAGPHHSGGGFRGVHVRPTFSRAASSSTPRTASSTATTTTVATGRVGTFHHVFLQ
jgi:hypothetical protein